MPLRVAYISSTFPNFESCGTGIYAGYLTKALSGLNHDIHVITTAREDIVNTHGRVTIHKSMTDWGLRNSPALIQTIMNINPDIVHINHSTSIAGQKSKFLVNFTPELLRPLRNIPILTTLHEFPQVSRLGRVKLLPLILGSDAITVTNLEYKKSLQNFIKTPFEKKIEVIDVGTNFGGDFKDTDSVSDRLFARRQWGLTENDLVLGFFGFLTPQKGFHSLIEILNILSKKNSNYKILALTSWNLSNEEYKNTLLKRVRDLELENKIVFTGYLKDHELWNALNAIDLVTFPFAHPIEERSSGVLRQALYKGLPTLTFAKDMSYAECGLKNGINIIFCENQNLNAFANKVEWFFADNKNGDLTDSFRFEARKLRSVLSFDHVANEMSRVYSKLLSR